jgi:hypothetical protein
MNEHIRQYHPQEEDPDLPEEQSFASMNDEEFQYFLDNVERVLARVKARNKAEAEANGNGRPGG